MGRVSIEPEGSALTTFSAVSAADIVDAVSTELKAAVSGTRYFITDVTVSNLDAAKATRVDILSDATLIWSGPAAINGGGYDHSFAVPLVCGVGEAINVKCETAGATVRAAVAGYTKLG